MCVCVSDKADQQSKTSTPTTTTAGESSSQHGVGGGEGGGQTDPMDTTLSTGTGAQGVKVHSGPDLSLAKVSHIHFSSSSFIVTIMWVPNHLILLWYAVCDHPSPLPYCTTLSLIPIYIATYSGTSPSSICIYSVVCSAYVPATDWYMYAYRTLSSLLVIYAGIRIYI